MAARILVVDDSPTIRKVVSAILSAKDYAPLLAEDGFEALNVLRANPIDLVLLDFVMPRMNGYQFCRQLRALSDLKNLPVVLMSAKGDRIREQFVQQTGAVDAITKPFDARGLVAVVEGALKKHAEGRTRPVPDADTMPDEDTLQEIVGLSLLPPRLGETDEVSTVAFSGALCEMVRPVLQQFPFAEEIERAMVAAVTPEVVRSLAATLPRTAAPEEQPGLYGDVSVVPVAEVLQLLQLQRQSGSLVISSRHRAVTVFVRNGSIDIAVSQGLRGEFLLGRYLVEDGAISREDLEEALAIRTDRKPSGELLVGLGLVSEEQVQHALTRQTAELIFECVRWQNGRFGFNADETSHEADQASLGLLIGALVIEGFRRVDEWRLIEKSFGFNDVLYRDQAAIEALGSGESLTKLERAVLDQIDGHRTVREVLDAIEGGSFELSKVVYQLLNSRLVRRARVDG